MKSIKSENGTVYCESNQNQVWAWAEFMLSQTYIWELSPDGGMVEFTSWDGGERFSLPLIGGMEPVEAVQIMLLIKLEAYQFIS